MARSDQLVDGDNVLYRMLHVLLDRHEDVAERVIDVMLDSTAIWFPPNVYQQLPILLPWVVRDPRCRPREVGGQVTADEWAAPDSRGYLRDDNSLIKNIPKALSIRGPTASLVTGARLGPAFVASHVWREVNSEKLASREPRLNSFVPNLVWLPRQIAKLSDLEGGYIQTALKGRSCSLYRSLAVRPDLKERVAEIWRLLPEPGPAPTKALKTFQFNFFDATPKFLASRRESVRQMLDFLALVVAGGVPLRKGRIPTRYFTGIQALSRETVRELYEQIRSLVPSHDCRDDDPKGTSLHA